MTAHSVPEGYQLPETDRALLGECEVHVFRATGPGGQSVNTTDSAVRLKHLPTGIVVLCRRERSQHRNKQVCLGRLRERIAAAMAPPPPPRKATKPTRAATQRRLAEKTRRASTKAARKRPPAED